MVCGNCHLRQLLRPVAKFELHTRLRQVALDPILRPYDKQQLSQKLGAAQGL